MQQKHLEIYRAVSEFGPAIQAPVFVHPFMGESSPRGIIAHQAPNGLSHFHKILAETKASIKIPSHFELPEMDGRVVPFFLLHHPEAGIHGIGSDILDVMRNFKQQLELRRIDMGPVVRLERSFRQMLGLAVPDLMPA